VTRQHAKSFFFASLALPKEKRAAAYAVYAFCRHADDLVDEAADAASVPMALEALSSEFDRCRDSLSDMPFCASLGHTIREYSLEKEPFLELLQGVASDNQEVEVRSWPELEHYCYQVASTVGLIMCPILGLADPAGKAQAIDLGIAMQLTNIARDVGEDLERGRVYLPADELRDFGLDRKDLQAGVVSDGFRELMRFQIRRAREYYRRSESGIALLAADGSQFTVWLMRFVYAGILEEIEKHDYDVFRRRAATSIGRKLRLAAKAWSRQRSTDRVVEK
jgi:phytoene synthase